MNITPNHFSLLQRAMDYAALNQRVVSQNMANVNTPGYESVEVQLRGGAESLLEVDDKADPFEVVHTGDPKGRNDRNNVDLDREIGKLNKTALLFKTFNQLLTNRLSQMRSAIQLR